MIWVDFDCVADPDDAENALSDNAEWFNGNTPKPLSAKITCCALAAFGPSFSAQFFKLEPCYTTSSGLL